MARILASRTFASSRQIQDFLRFACELSFQGRTQVDQAEIAAKILRKTAAFNPLEDASVRRIATLTRHKLTHYYQTEGAGERVIMTHPYHSYLPVFVPAISVAALKSTAPPLAPARFEKSNARIRSIAVASIAVLLGLVAWGVGETSWSFGAAPGLCARWARALKHYIFPTAYFEVTADPVIIEALEMPESRVLYGRRSAGRCC